MTNRPHVRAHSGFTLIELTIVILIIAILSLGLLTQFKGATEKARFKAQAQNVLRIMQNARSMSLTRKLIADSPVEYYKLDVTEDFVNLAAVAEDGSPEQLEYYEFENGYAMDSDFSAYFFSPSGSLCFTDELSSCDSAGTEESVRFETETGALSATFTLNINGSYPELSY